MMIGMLVTGSAMMFSAANILLWFGSICNWQYITVPEPVTKLLLKLIISPLFKALAPVNTSSCPSCVSSQRMSNRPTIVTCTLNAFIPIFETLCLICFGNFVLIVKNWWMPHRFNYPWVHMNATKLIIYVLFIFIYLILRAKLIFLFR